MVVIMFENRIVLDKIANNVVKKINKEYEVRFIHLSENATYVVYSDDKPLYTIRISRSDYRTMSQLESEIAWLNIIKNTDIPAIIPVDIMGRYVNYIDGYFVTLFEYIDGEMPEYNDINVMYECGRLAALLHNSVKPDYIDRPVWSIDNMTGENGLWGNWRLNSELTEDDIILIDNIIEESKLKINDYKTNKYGLIHIDLRMTNLIKSDKFYAIDFDDCGFGYYIQDLAAALSFMETSDNIDELKSVWYKGYEEISFLTDEDKAMADTFIFLRRIQLLAWITSHCESDYVKTVSKGFVKETMKFVKNYNTKTGIAY